MPSIYLLIYSIYLFISSSLKLEYENLKESCLGDGIHTCRLCGYDQALNNQNLKVEICDSCNMVSTVSSSLLNSLSLSSLFFFVTLSYSFIFISCSFRVKSVIIKLYCVLEES